VVSAGGSGELLLRATADGGDHGRACPAGELNRRVPDRAGSTGNEHEAPAEGVRMETSWAVFGDSQRPVGGGGGDPDAGAELEVRGIRQREGAFGGDHRAWAVPLAGRPSPASVTQTRSPALKPTTPAPNSSTTPAPSWFGTVGSAGAPLVVPLRDFQSVGFTPETTMRIRTSPSAGSGIGRSTSSRTDGSPGRV
jgi:hypothetical protein